MSIEAKLIIDGKEIKVLSYNFSFDQIADTNGRPSSKPVFNGLWVVIESQKGVNLEEWAIAINQDKLVELHIAPVVLGGKTKIYYFLNSHLVKWQVYFSATGIQPMTEALLIKSAGVKDSNSTEQYEAYWLTAQPNTTPVTTINYNEEKEPKITKIDWLNPETNKKIKEITYDENISLQIEIRDAIGGTAIIVIKKEDGNDFEEGKTELTFTEAVDEDGIVTVTPFLIEPIWAETKVQTYDFLVAKVTYNGITKESKEIKLIPFPQVVVDFRPEDKYIGEYGFDYLREGKLKKDKITYKGLLGEVKKIDPKTGKKLKTPKFFKFTTDAKYNHLKNTHYPFTDKDGKTITLDWREDFEGNKIALDYTQTHLTIYPNTSVKLSLQVETFDDPNELTFVYDKTYFTLDKQTIPAQSKGKKRLHDFLTITASSKEFTEDQVIKVRYKDRLLGQLNVLKNDKASRKKTNIVLVQVETDITGDKKKGSFTSKSGKPEEDMVKRILKQAYITGEVKEVLAFNPTAIKDPTTNKLKYPDFNADYALVDTSDVDRPKILNKHHNTKNESLAHFMEKAFNKANPTYKNHRKIFFFGDVGGRKKKSTGVVTKLAGNAKEFNTSSAV
ncbi:MAG: hypothetical protein L3J23_09720, partial [Flavobacteriaceae bacterium]|nr:hypothetical protein [Flavobacteriaceae bacterium]